MFWWEFFVEGVVTCCYMLLLTGQKVLFAFLLFGCWWKRVKDVMPGIPPPPSGRPLAGRITSNCQKVDLKKFWPGRLAAGTLWQRHGWFEFWAQKKKDYGHWWLPFSLRFSSALLLGDIYGILLWPNRTASVAQNQTVVEPDHVTTSSQHFTAGCFPKPTWNGGSLHHQVLWQCHPSTSAEGDSGDYGRDGTSVILWSCSTWPQLLEQLDSESCWPFDFLQTKIEEMTTRKRCKNPKQAPWNKATCNWLGHLTSGCHVDVGWSGRCLSCPSTSRVHSGGESYLGKSAGGALAQHPSRHGWALARPRLCCCGILVWWNGPWVSTRKVWNSLKRRDITGSLHGNWVGD